MNEDTRDAYRERGLGGTQRAGQRPCLLIVDLSRGFTEPSSPLGCEAERALATVAELLAACRAHDVPRVFTTIEYDDAGLVTAAPFLEKMPSLAALRPGSGWSDIDPRVAPNPGEPVLTKLFASAFWGTPLSSLLVARGCDSVIVTGASTSGCVRATVVDALQHGLRVVVPRDGVADRADGPHQASLFDIEAKYGEVVDTADALARVRETDTVTAGALR